MEALKLSALVAEVQKEPFVVDIGDGEPVIIKHPSEADVRRIWEEASMNWEVIRELAADDAERLDAALDAAPAGTRQALLDRMQGHFGTGNSPASPPS